jgi:hypothetical protein
MIWDEDLCSVILAQLDHGALGNIYLPIVSGDV